MNRVAVFVLGALFLEGCAASVVPGPVTNFLTGGDTRLASTIEQAAANWAKHGLEIANFVTVDDEGAGLPVRFATMEELTAGRDVPPDTTIDASTVFVNGKWKHLWVDEFFADKPGELLRILTHELVHALVPRAPHLEGAPGNYTAKTSSGVITRADLAHLARYTEVTPSQVPFDGEESAT